jgi:3-phenylpropionate/trans-cinnamate dioxygenase ferredoxin subunit
LLPGDFAAKGGLSRSLQRRRAGGSDGKRDQQTMSEKSFVAVAKLEDVPAGTKKVVEAGRFEIVLCHTQDRLFAVENLCSHAHEKVDCGKMKNGWISCPVHGARFDLETGEPMNPPATMPIRTFEVRVVGDTIEVAV